MTRAAWRAVWNPPVCALRGTAAKGSAMRWLTKVFTGMNKSTDARGGDHGVILYNKKYRILVLKFYDHTIVAFLGRREHLNYSNDKKKECLQPIADK